MYQLDPNINTAIQRQAEQVRAVNAYGFDNNAAARSADGGHTNRAAGLLALLLAAAAPIALLMVWGLLGH